ncbi:MAG: hypothetical protein HY910_15855 [Desulfarculus sp.]|nr:hypothetical protein [Desulfarculus sp.]
MPDKSKRLNPRQALMALRHGWGETDPSRLPFCAGDISAGVENELQAVVVGKSQAVDLPQTIQESLYYTNVKKRLQRGELPQRALEALDQYLRDNLGQVWENSWVRLPLDSLGPATRQMLERDLLADKQDPAAGRRQDEGLFFCRQEGRGLLRVPISYLLKLALAQALESQDGLPALIAHTGRRFLGHYLSDNTSPETFSFHVVEGAPEGGLGLAVAGETAKRFLLTSLLIDFARSSFELGESGQDPLVYFAPHPPVRQKQLNAAIPDSFYRELFMSPCLSGWDRGEEKHRYMHLCHQVLSRSQLNTLVKLREAGIIQNNLVVLPHTSNISLANNGTHVSLGSRLLSQAMADPGSGFGPAQEKFVGDLAIKFMEHFLPLFVGAYSAAPYRLDFQDFHPERVLGFLPHELDYTHLRMLWRRWKKKAHLKALGVRLTPFGPQVLDKALAWLFRLRGDLVPDFRLVDYLAAVLSTEESPALDGKLGNQERLKHDLAQAGVFDQSMATYLLCRQRPFASLGFSGFEGRHYSLFPSLAGDMAPAVNLQALLTALAFGLIAQGRLRHADIPDDPQVESERRQIFFGAAVGVPTFYVHRRTGNRLLLSLVRRTPGLRLSRRYPNYLRVYNVEYRQALLEYLRREAADLCQGFGGPALLTGLGQRLDGRRERAADQRLCAGILEHAGARRALALPAGQFNQAAEAYYRQDLRRHHLQEGLEFLARDLATMQTDRAALGPEFRLALDFAAGGREASLAARELTPAVLAGNLEPAGVLRLINLLIVSLAHDARQAQEPSAERDVDHHAKAAAPVH